MSRLFSKQDDAFIRQYYPIIGVYQPKFHKSLMELTGKSKRQIGDHASKIGIKKDLTHRTTKNTKWCNDCLIRKPLTEFWKINPELDTYKKMKPSSVKQYKGRVNRCKDCSRLIQKEKEKNIDFLLLKRYRVRLMNEGNFNGVDKARKSLKQIIERIGYPNTCLFNDKYCDNDGDPRKLEFGHIISEKRNGTIADPKNVIWICRRHNWIMSDSSLKELYETVCSLLEK
tara:strand:- start:90 stop:773 length:684 start_codon:yes stop_codon:yes gene_type:complete